MEPSHFIADYTGLFKDIRFERRAKMLWNKLSATPCSSIRRLSSNYSEQKAYYRFLNNSRVSETEIIQEATQRMEKLGRGKNLLCIQDTCEINLYKHKGRLRSNSGLGRSDNADNATCFKLHPGLVIDAESLSPLGFSDIKVFHRAEDMPDRIQRKYKKQSIEEKESYKWIQVAQHSKKVLNKSTSVTFIEDREGDIYEQFVLVPDQKTHLLVRSRTSRKLTNSSDLYKEVDLVPVAGTYTIDVPTDKRKNQYRRTAQVELRFTPCNIQCPENLRSKAYPPSIKLWCISVKEVEEHKSSKPISWKLLTTHQIQSYDKALLMVEWYCARWYVEQLFRLLKKQGFGIEQTELESGWAIRKLTIMQMSALLKILQMNIAYADPEGGQAIEEVLDQQQIEVLHLMNKKLQGETKKQQNLNDPKTTKWAAWVVGRLGGWKGYDSQGPPGVIVLKRGLDRLNYIIEGINLTKDVYTQ